jgi:hypothetical protein
MVSVPHVFFQSKEGGTNSMNANKFVDNLPDLISPEDYADDPDGTRVRLKIRVTADGIEVLGDAMRPIALEKILAALSSECVEQMLCG